MYPFLARRVVFPLQERLKGKSTLSLLKELERSQWLPAGRMQELQFDRLKQQLEFAYHHVPYYRRLFDEHGTPPHRINDFTDFHRIPFLTRETLRAQFDTLRSRLRIRGVQKISTGGSTGSPVAVLIDPVRNSFIDAARLRSHRWFDADLGVREIVLWGSPIEITRQDYIRSMRDLLLNSKLLSAFNLGERNLLTYCETIIRYRPVKMYGYASALYLLARYFRRAKLRPPQSLKVVFATAEPLFDFQRRTIEEVFGVKVAVEYGARDAGLMANECPSGGLHISAEGMVVEIERSNSEVLGEVVVTNLHSRAMPIIRYRTGDVGELGAEPCPCGRGLPLLKKIDGRQTDFIMTPDGRVVHALAVIYVLRECPQVEKFQVIQDSIDNLTVTIVPRAELQVAVRERIVHDLQRVLGTEMQIDLVISSVIPSSASGKFRYVVSKIAASHLSTLEAPA
jgi:phenylacetate-CoA ligase